MTRGHVVHMPNISSDHLALQPACGTYGYLPNVTSDPDAVTCQRARCQENAHTARLLFGKTVDDMSQHERDMLRRLLIAAEPPF